MPLYEYECTKCHRKTEKIESVAGPHLKKCPHCGGKVERLVGAPAIQFKGAGWYVTDYAGKKSGSSEGSEKASTSEKSEGTKETAKEATKDTAKDTKEKKGGKK
ncbi:MAG TPA: FmdB family zinc ribbon protein [Candidatus Saccharimonadales bacterium]|nr:FmdB family zinc ribbon protein [Candidatus Saccharimonadales bacterium]